jgi:hypothetical protein
MAGMSRDPAVYDLSCTHVDAFAEVMEVSVTTRKTLLARKTPFCQSATKAQKGADFNFRNTHETSVQRMPRYITRVRTRTLVAKVTYI